MDDLIHTIQPKNPSLVEITTPLQASRGNRKFFCQEAYVSYITYANGYVRREINAEYCNPIYRDFPPKNGIKIVDVRDQQVLNKRKSILKSYGWGVCRSKKIIKEPCPQARIDMIDRISTNYKGYTGRFCRPGYTLVWK